MGDPVRRDCICMELPHIPQTDDAQPKILHGAPLTVGLPRVSRSGCQLELFGWRAFPGHPRMTKRSTPAEARRRFCRERALMFEARHGLAR